MQAVTFRVEGDLARRAEAPRDLGEVGRRLDPVRRDRGDRFRSRSGLRLEDGLLEPLVPSTKRLEAFLVGDHVEAAASTISATVAGASVRPINSTGAAALGVSFPRSDGRLRALSLICVATPMGHRTDTPMR